MKLRKRMIINKLEDKKENWFSKLTSFSRFMIGITREKERERTRESERKRERKGERESETESKRERQIFKVKFKTWGIHSFILRTSILIWVMCFNVTSTAIFPDCFNYFRPPSCLGDSPLSTTCSVQLLLFCERLSLENLCSLRLAIEAAVNEMIGILGLDSALVRLYWTGDNLG